MPNRLPYQAPDFIVFGPLATLTLETGGDDCYTAPGKCFDYAHDTCEGRSRVESLDGGAGNNTNPACNSA